MIINRVIASGLALACAACAPGQSDETAEANSDQAMTEHQQADHELALTAANEDFDGADGFEEFLASLHKEGFPGGGYIVDGDIFLADEDAVRDFYFGDLAQTATMDRKFAVRLLPTGARELWNDQDKRELSYCVSTRFGNNYERVITAMKAAEAAWEGAANIQFNHDRSQDGDCGPNNNSVKFDVQPVIGEPYYGRAFFPSDARMHRKLLINTTGLRLPDAGKGLTLVGLLRHELGHALGAAHEHYRSHRSGKCSDTENTPVEGLTELDQFSVMHYPHCKGLAGWGLNLTDSDRNGAACIYGPAAGFSIDTSLIPEPGRCVAA